MGCAMKFTIQITETLQKLVEVDADSAEMAELEIRRRYRLGEIVLGAADHVDTEMEVWRGTESSVLCRLA